MTERDGLIAAFLAQHGWKRADRRPLAGDASFRRYHRLTDGRQRAVLMDAPPPKEDVRPFVRVARHLGGLGYSAPVLLAVDVDNGLLLLEDLGDATFTRLLADGADEGALYRLAVDLLIDLHRRGPAALAVDVPPYDDERLLAEALLLTDWYMPEMIGGPLPDAVRREYVAIWRDLLPVARQVADSLVLRDFHVDNLMRLDGRPGLAACGLLDFQDAVIGPCTYDPMSLIEDARRDLAPGLAEALRQRYLAAFPGLDAAAFAASWAVLAAQRHAKVIGIFTRLCRRDGKPVYLRHIPRVWRRLLAALDHPRLAGFGEWLDRHLPADKRGAPAP